jgi:hypothetical protein
MPDSESLRLDSEILRFIRQFSNKPASDGEFQALALKIFNHQYTRNSFYKKFCDAEGKTPDAIKTWKEIPAMPTVGFKELVLTSFPQTKAVKVFKTSGTTSGTSGAHFFDTLKLYEAAISSPFRNFLLPDGAHCQFFFLTASPNEAPHSSLSHMMGVVNSFSKPQPGKFYVKNEKLLAKELVKSLKKIGTKKAMLLGTAFSLRFFLDYLSENKIMFSLPAGSRLMETGGFKGKVKEISKKKLYLECERLLGIKPEFCVSEYGMTELSSQFYDSSLKEAAQGKKGRRKLGPAWIRALIIDEKTGEEAKPGSKGLMRFVDLANRGSVMAIQTEDVGRSLGDGFELLGRKPNADVRGCSLSYEELIHG